MADTNSSYTADESGTRSFSKDYINDPAAISQALQNYFTLIVAGVGCLILSAIGLFTNVVNMIVFSRQGLKDGVTISFTALSISDFAANLCMFFFSICRILGETGWLSLVIDWTDFRAVSFAWPRAMFVDISMLTTVLVSVERALCVAMPLKFKDFMTPSRTVKILLVNLLFIMACYAPIYATCGLSWRLDDATNTTRLLQWFSPTRRQVEQVSNYLVYIAVPILCFTTVSVCTYIMITALRSSSKFRARSTTSKQRGGLAVLPSSLENYVSMGSEIKDNSDNSSSIGPVRNTNTYRLIDKERKVVKVVVLVAVVFILCTIPNIAAVLTRRTILEFCAGGAYENLMWVVYALVYFTGGINASINMFVYLGASTKYKEIFWQMFCRNARSNQSAA